MDTLINLIIIGFIINLIYKSMKQIEKQKKPQRKSKEKIVYPKIAYKYNIPKTDKNVVTKSSYSKLPKPNKKENKASVDNIEEYKITNDYGHIEEYESQMQADLLNFNLAQGIIMSEILGPPISKRGYHFSRKKL